MFLGHFAAAFAAKRLAPRVSLGSLVAAALLLDLIWPILVLVGVERVKIDPDNTVFTPLDFAHYPISHSVVTTVGWALLTGGVYYAVSRCSWSSLWVGLLVLSHWLLDAIVHRPDLPLMPTGETYLGLGLWNSFAGTLALESLLFVLGVAMYRAATRPNNQRASVSLLALVSLLLVIYGAAAFGPPPPNPDAVAWGALAAWLFVFWAAWLDRQRQFLQ